MLRVQVSFCAVAYGPHLASDSDEHFSEAEQCAKGTTKITSGAPDSSPFATGPQSILSNVFYCWMRTRNKTWRRVGTVQIPKYAGWRILMWQLTAARGDVPRGGIVAHAAHPSHPSAVTIHEGRRSPRPGRQTGPRPSSEILQPGTLTLAGSSLPCTPPAPHCPVVGQHLSLSHRRKARKKKRKREDEKRARTTPPRAHGRRRRVP